MLNGVVSGKTQTHGSIIHFECKDGYRLIGASYARCEDGKWSEISPRCAGWCFIITDRLIDGLLPFACYHMLQN